MEKLLAYILSFISVFTANSLLIKSYAVASDNNSVIEFIENASKMIHENDIGKNYIPENIETDFNAETPVAINSETVEKNDSKSLLESHIEMLSNDRTFSKGILSETAFQTCRLIIKANKRIEKLNSVDIASGFDDWYLVQFESEKDTQSAYNYYSTCNYVDSVTPDYVYNIELYSANGQKREKTVSNNDETPTRLNSWGSVETGLYDLKDYIQNNIDSPCEIVVGVLDTGVYLNNEFIKNRIKRTYYSVLADGSIGNSEADFDGHGTMVSSVLVDNTPENVKVAVYKVENDTVSSESENALAFLKMVKDEVDVINCSIGILDKSGIFRSALDKAYELGIPVIAAAGNFGEALGTIKYQLYPASYKNIFTVGAYAADGLPTGWTAFGDPVNVLAPGEDISVSYGETYYTTEDGTSLSSPMVAALFANLMTLYPGISYDELKFKIESSTFQTDLIEDAGLFGYGVIDALSAAGLERTSAPQISLESGKYTGEISIELITNDDCQIYYTTDSSYPSKENGILYSKPISLSNDIMFLKAVAYSQEGFKSTCSKEMYRLQTIGKYSDFEISNDGIITSYIGNAVDLIIPDVINGIVVTGVGNGAFNDSKIQGITIPETVENIGYRAFFDNQTLMFADGTGIKHIGLGAFRSSHIYVVDFPNIETIEETAFYNCDFLSYVCFPNCIQIGKKAFFGCNSLRYAEMTSLINVGTYAFSRCTMLTDVIFPKLETIETNVKKTSYVFEESLLESVLDLKSVKSIPKTLFYTINSDIESSDTSLTIYNKEFFSNFISIKRLELSQVEEIYELPVPMGCLFEKPCSLVLPSTLNSCSDSYLNEVNNDCFIVYGSRGTFAEQWANEHFFKFVEIGPETAVINDLPTVFYDYMRFLFADVVGFNKTYQWYGTTTESNEGGMPISGATSSLFVPKNYTQYPYYYCVVTSTDVGYKPIEIRTGTSRYMDFDDNIKFADYSALNAVLETIPSDLSIYTEDSVDALNDVIAKINRNYYLDEQETVNGFVESVSTAISNLVLKKFVVSFIVDGESVKTENVEFGATVNVPENPNKEGYVFKEWIPKIPETMPAKSLTFYAVFEEKKQFGKIPSVNIRNFITSRTVDFKTTITFKADIAHLPEKACVVWYKDGEAICSGEKFTVEHATETFVVQARVFDESGKALAESEIELVKVKTDFFSRIIAFFRMIFKALPVTEQ